MKNKTKIMLGLAALTAGTLAAGATGTFAWFTTNKTATATYSNIVAAGTTGNIKVAIKGVTDKDEGASASIANSVSATGKASAMSDVSSKDGLTFAQPDWKESAGNAKAYNKINNVSTSAGYFTQFIVTIYNGNASVEGEESNGDVSVKLTGMEITTAGSTLIADWTRVAIITGASEANGFLSGTFGALYQKSVTAGTNDKYVAPSDTAGTSLALLDAKPEAASSSLSFDVGKIASAGSVDLGVSVWLEGTMNDAQDTAKGESVQVKLTFSATNA